ncbi:MAG: ISAzo13 family transposase [candidate division Zixibacteria bacterium]|nr:ISAzo13 family transposase [candidate division Zixibacteria bacterium]
MQNDLVATVHRKFQMLSPSMNERMLRLWTGAEAQLIGRGGITIVSKATGVAHTTIRRGIRELEQQAQTSGNTLPQSRIRRPGAGRKNTLEKDPQLLEALESLVDPVTRGDPESPLRWTCKSTRRLAEELCKLSHPVCPRKVAHLLYEAGYSLQANRKTREGNSHPDRNAQFEYINAQVKKFQRSQQPVVSVDTKKKEIVGDFRNVGKEYRKKGCPEDVRVHDFQDKELGKAIPYGVYDIASNEGWVNVGIDHDTSQFAARSILLWWQEMGQRRFPRATRLMITADGGGSNGSRSRLWKMALQDLATELNMTLSICHFPPGTSKWNKIEHRLFSFITQNWRGKPLRSLQAIVNLIGSTSTKGGLIVKAHLDTNQYDTGIQVSEVEMARLRICPHDFHGEWNYTVKPKHR